MRQGVAILGSTGSIGCSAEQVIAAHPDRFTVTGIVGRTNLDELARQAALLRPGRVITTDPARKPHLAALLATAAPAPWVEGGMEPVIDLVTSPDTDIVLCAIVGTAGLEPVIAALRAGKRVALASKEILVLAGEIIARELAANPAAELIPVDSEHSAVFQCLTGRSHREIRHLYLTASGGAFRGWSAERIAAATLADALKHPTWNMGCKVTVDSASMMNKALEMIEACHLFRVKPEQIRVLIHPQSVVHSMVELCDSSLLAQLSVPDMRFAIQYALSYPDRLADELPRLDFSSLINLEFEEALPATCPAIRFAAAAMARGGTLPGVMNAANEVAVEHFCRDALRFPQIYEVIERTMAAHATEEQTDFETVRVADAWARQYAAEVIARLSS